MFVKCLTAEICVSVVQIYRYYFIPAIVIILIFTKCTKFVQNVCNFDKIVM